MIKTPVMIVGAGPTGLMLSAQLHRFGTKHHIIDKKSGVTRLSKALGVQARTLEYYRQLGIAESVLEKGFIADSVKFVVNGSHRATVPLGEIGKGLSPYPFLFILEQSENEKLLLDYSTAKQGTVSWETEAGNFSITDTGYSGTLQYADGSSEDFECDYLIGCAGGDSSVRHFLEIPFDGKTNEQVFFVADARVLLGLEKEGLVLALNHNEFLAFFPMSQPDQYRVIGVIPETVKDVDHLSEGMLRDHIEKNFGADISVELFSWMSSYRVHHRIARAFHSDNAFLLGDEAHIHSPAGAQGMNTGLGDAANLGWKLAAVCNGWAESEILESYDIERRPFGQQLVKTTDRAFETIVSRKWLPRFTRTQVLPKMLPLLLKLQFFRELMFKTVSQTRIHYRHSPLSDQSEYRNVKSGDRFPWFEWSDGNCFEWFREPGYLEICLGNVEATGLENWSGPYRYISIDKEMAKAAVAAGLPDKGTVLVRPDMHISRITLS